MTGGGIGFARSPSDQIRKARFGLAEAADAERQEKHRDRGVIREALGESLLCPPSTHQRKPSMTPTSGLRE